MTKTMPVAISSYDVVRNALIEMGSVFQQFHARCLDLEEMQWLERKWLGPRFDDHVVMEIIYRITYNRLHCDSKFDWVEMSVEELVASVNHNYIHPVDRNGNPDAENIKRSVVFDDLLREIERLVDQKLADTELLWHWWEPMVTIVRRTCLEISMYDHRAYTFMTEMLAREQEDEEEGGE